MRISFMRLWRNRSLWQVTSLFAWAGVATGVVLAAAALALQYLAGSYTILAVPVGLFAGVVIVPAALIGLVFVHASRQEAADRIAKPVGQ